MHNIKVLHLEPTDVCQAACPLCIRETDVEFNKTQAHHLDMYKILQVFGNEEIAALDKMFTCGNYGDPAAGKHTLNIYQEFRRINKSIVLGMNSNGGLQNTAWWHDLGTMFDQPLDYVVFSIDGLEDTNSIYRRNVVWGKVIDNALAYIAAGGSAHWDMLVYQHNQHQVDECQALAKSLGFTHFRAKVSKRPLVNNLEFPVGWAKPSVTQGPIVCHAIQEQSLYIDAQARVSPCCWLSNRQSNFVKNIDQVAVTWNTSTPDKICQQTCTRSAQGSSFTNQWQREVSFC
jgi:sulfatase maturation enzyme AslB (radical SAM superfamily)